ncbi:UNVERIFIED_CONTAM: hypothetical protein FKN15_056213 [Acipenser sinensis]
MASHGQLSQNELLEIDISCDDNCSAGENDVFVNSGASYDGFPAFQQWVPAAAPPTEFGESEGGASLFAHSPPSTRHSTQNHEPEDTVRLCSDSDDSCDIRHRGAGNPLSPRSSIVDYLLIELYDTYTCNSRKSADSVDSSTEASGSDAFLGRSNTESNFLQELQEKQTKRHQMQYLAQKDIDELKRIIQEVNYRIGVQSAKLVRQVKRKDRLANKVQKNNDIITACLQAVSQKRRSAHRYHPCADSGGAKMNTRCPPKHVPSVARFFTLCRLTVQPPQSYSVGGQCSSRLLTGKPAGARPDYGGRWCAVSRGHPGRPNPPSPRTTLGQLSAAPSELPSTVGCGIAWTRTGDVQAIERKMLF